jgi:hypothetical protein
MDSELGNMMNSDSESDSHPVIRQIPVKHPDGNCTCDGSSLQFNGHWFTGNIDQYYQQVAYTPKGRIAKKQPGRPPKQPYMWWKAQCSFRGLSPKGKMAELQELLKAHANDPISKDNLALLEMAKKDFKIKNRAAVEDKWIQGMSADEKATRDLGRYLREAFPVGESVTGVVVIKVGCAVSTKVVAEELGLVAEIVVGPIDPKGYSPVGERWVVVGRKKSAVVEKVRIISREAEGIKKEIRDKEEAQKRMAEAIHKKKEQDLKAALAKCDDWDVTGTWKIRFPYIEENFSRMNWGEKEMTLRIYQETTPKGSQMFAEFNFGLIKGVFRFERQKDDVKAKAAQPDSKNNTQKRKRDEFEDYGRSGEYDSEDFDDYDPYGNRKRSPTPEAFYLGSVTQPSAKHQSWNYRWRGEETGETVIDLYSDRKIYSLKFFGPRAEKLEGTFGCGFMKDSAFTGVKVGVARNASIDIAEAWADRNERAYEHARVGRWG